VLQGTKEKLIWQMVLCLSILFFLVVIYLL